MVVRFVEGIGNHGLQRTPVLDQNVRQEGTLLIEVFTSQEPEFIESGGRELPGFQAGI